jgi:hypothetical protein
MSTKKLLQAGIKITAQAQIEGDPQFKATSYFSNKKFRNKNFFERMNIQFSSEYYEHKELRP